jgi:hypothetical protein
MSETAATLSEEAAHVGPLAFLFVRGHERDGGGFD